MKRYLGILGYIRFGYRLGFGDGIGNCGMNDELPITCSLRRAGLVKLSVVSQTLSVKPAPTPWL